MSPFPSSSIEGSRGPFGSLDWGGPRGSLVVLVVLVIMLALAAPAGAWQGELANSAGAASRAQLVAGDPLGLIRGSAGS